MIEKFNSFKRMLLVDLQNSTMSGKNNKTSEEHWVMLFYHRVEMLEVIFEYSLTVVYRTLEQEQRALLTIMILN